MAEITAAQVKELRQLTDLPMMECKRALVEADGDQEQAIAILKEQNQKVMLKRADNATSEGRIAIAVADDGSTAAMIELQCESAPVANNDEFQALAENCARQLLTGPGADDPDALLDQPSPDDDSRTLRESYEEVVSKIREKIVLAKVTRVDGPAAGYVHHDGKTGVLFVASGEDSLAEVLRDVAMHIAATPSEAVRPDQVDATVLEKEKELLEAQARESGKPEEIIEKIISGRVNKFLKEVCVETQPFVKDPQVTVGQLVKNTSKALGTGINFDRFVKFQF